MGMQNSDDEKEIMEDRADLEWHFNHSPPSERARWERMSDDERAYYEHDVKERLRNPRR